MKEMCLPPGPASFSGSPGDHKSESRGGPLPLILTQRDGSLGQKELATRALGHVPGLPWPHPTAAPFLILVLAFVTLRHTSTVVGRPEAHLFQLDGQQ